MTEHKKFLSSLRNKINVDSSRIIERFGNGISYQITDFYEVWNSTHFQYILEGTGSLTASEISVLLDECYNAAKRVLFDDNFSETYQIGAFFLLSAFYYKQPFKFYCRIKFDMKTWNQLKQFVDRSLMGANQNREIFYTFRRLIKNNAFYFTASERYYAAETCKPSKNLELNSYSIVNFFKYEILTHLYEITNKTNNNLLTTIKRLETHYNAIKNEIKKRNEEFVGKDCYDQLAEGFRKIEIILGLEDTISKNSSVIGNKRQSIKRKAMFCDSNYEFKTEEDEDYKPDISDMKQISKSNKTGKKKHQRHVYVYKSAQLFNDDIPDDVYGSPYEEPTPSTSKIQKEELDDDVSLSILKQRLLSSDDDE